MPRREDAVWNRFACIYDRFIKKDMHAYQKVIGKITGRLKLEDRVLEIATGTGILSLGIAGHVKELDAVDFSPEMIRRAKAKARELGVENVRFAVGDATNLLFSAGSFDAVILSNTLHIMPEPKRALEEVKRVLKPDGILIAPTFVHANSRKAALRSRLMSLTGFRAYHKWTQQGFHAFLEQNGFSVIESDLLQASFPLAYAAARKQ